MLYFSSSLPATHAWVSLSVFIPVCPALTIEKGLRRGKIKKAAAFLQPLYILLSGGMLAPAESICNTFSAKGNVAVSVASWILANSCS